MHIALKSMYKAGSVWQEVYRAESLTQDWVFIETRTSDHLVTLFTCHCSCYVCTSTKSYGDEEDETEWFSKFLPSSIVLPASPLNSLLMHSIKVVIPQGQGKPKLHCWAGRRGGNGIQKMQPGASNGAAAGYGASLCKEICLFLLWFHDFQSQISLSSSLRSMHVRELDWFLLKQG